MKIRLSVVLTVVLSTLALTAAAVQPAQAAAPPAVLDLQITGQAQGAVQTWSVSASWSAAPGADRYLVAVVDQADGSISQGSHYGSKDVDGLSTTVAATGLLTDHTYWVAVRPVTGTEIGLPSTAAFQAIALDTAAPTGTFVLDRTHAYIGTELFRTMPGPFRLTEDFYDEDSGSEVEVSFQLRQTTLADNTTPAAQIVREVRLDTGKPKKRWNQGAAILVYGRAGTFHPEVVLTDQYGNSSTVALPTISVTLDGRAPVVRIIRPRPEMRARVAGWRVLRGTVTDNRSGVLFVLAIVTERRGGFWYSYDFTARTWTKGSRDLQATLEDVEPAFMMPAGRRWRTPRIAGLTAGILHIETVALDRAFNFGAGPTIHRRIDRAS